MKKIARIAATAVLLIVIVSDLLHAQGVTIPSISLGVQEAGSPDDVVGELWAELQAVGGAGGIMTDGAWAVWYAEKIVHRGWPRRRVLCTAFRWADELLSIPEVWSAAEGVAARLLAQGVIRRRREIDRLLGGLDGVLERSPRHRTWRRRMPWLF